MDGTTTFLWLELSTRCQLECTHCYNASGPHGNHGAMTLRDWRRVIDEAAGLGVRDVQMIGGEPSLYPHLIELIRHARACELGVEVYSNLVHIGPELWTVLAQPGVRLATSWYSDDPDEHQLITRRPTHQRTRDNIVQALARSIPLRVGIVDMHDGQRTTQAEAAVRALGVTEVRHDRLRRVGRADPAGTAVTELCGNCGRRGVAILPSGDVAPCPLGRWLTVGNVLIPGAGLGELLAAARDAAAEHIAPALATAGTPTACQPNNDTCNPPCEPQCNPGCT